MAGPLSSEEIEDVVSSVRRLVSNEQRIKTRDLNAEKLVLTSAYRVVPEQSPLSSAQSGPQSGLQSPLMLDAPLVEALPKPVPAAPDADDMLEDSLAQALAVEPELVAEDAGPVTGATPEAPFADTVEAEWEDEIWTEPGQVSLGEAALAAEEAEVLMAPEPEPEPAPEPETEPDVIEVAAFDATEGSTHDTVWTDEPVPFVPLRRRAEDLAARVAAGAVVEPPAAANPDSPVPLAGDQAPDQTPDPAPAEAAPASDPSRMATDLYDADGTPLAVLDESALNEIVRQVLRAELQGELGERITRNVRKLVRAEINRALLARDLD